MRGIVTLFIPAVLLAVGCSRVETSPAADFVTLEAPVMALTNARIIDGTGSPGRAGQTVIIRGGKIEAVGDARTVTAPPGAGVIDLSGRTLVPGFVMLHEHLFGTPDGSGYVNTPATSARLYLAGGAPEDRVSANEQVEMVFKKGAAYDPAKLIESTRGIVFEK